jgi:hypothetical protein
VSGARPNAKSNHIIRWAASPLVRGPLVRWSAVRVPERGDHDSHRLPAEAGSHKQENAWLKPEATNKKCVAEAGSHEQENAWPKPEATNKKMRG